MLRRVCRAPYSSRDCVEKHHSGVVFAPGLECFDDNRGMCGSSGKPRLVDSECLEGGWLFPVGATALATVQDVEEQRARAPGYG